MKLDRGRAMSLSALFLGCILTSVFACTGNGNRVRDKKEEPAQYNLPPQGAMTAQQLNDLQSFMKDYLHDNKAHHQNRDASSGCSKCVDVEIEAVGRTTDIDENTAPASPRVVARILNNGGQTAATYKLKPKSEAEYYVWVDLLGNKSRGTVVEITKQKDGSGLVAYNDQGFLKNCHDGNTSTESDANFYSCGSAHVPAAAINTSGLANAPWFGLLRTLIARVRQIGDTTRPIGEDPAWIHCLNGCCTVGSAT